MRFAAGFLFGVFVAGALLPLSIIIGATLIGLGLGTLWARRRARARSVVPPWWLCRRHRRRFYRRPWPPEEAAGRVESCDECSGRFHSRAMPRGVGSLSGFCPLCGWSNDRHAADCPTVAA